MTAACGARLWHQALLASVSRSTIHTTACTQSAERMASTQTSPSTDQQQRVESNAQTSVSSPGSEAAQQQTTARREAIFGSRRVMASRRSNQPLALEGIVHINNTFNNIHVLLTERNGSIRACSSAGTVGFRGARKSQPVAAERAAEELAKKALKLGYSSVDVRLKGAGPNKQYAVQALRACGLNISSLADVTPIPYNGCRPPKRRRV